MHPDCWERAWWLHEAQALAESATNGSTPNDNSLRPRLAQRSHREPDWVIGICDHCDDRSGPAIVDKETGNCRKCWHEPEEISR